MGDDRGDDRGGDGRAAGSFVCSGSVVHAPRRAAVWKPATVGIAPARPRSASGASRQSTRVCAPQPRRDDPEHRVGREVGVEVVRDRVRPRPVIADGVVRCTSLSVTPRTTTAWRKSPAATMPGVSGCSVGSRYHCTVRPVSATRPAGNTPCPPGTWYGTGVGFVIVMPPSDRTIEPTWASWIRSTWFTGTCRSCCEQADRARDAVEAQDVAQLLRARERHGRGHGQDLDRVAGRVDAGQDHRPGDVLVRVDARHERRLPRRADRRRRERMLQRRGDAAVRDLQVVREPAVLVPGRRGRDDDDRPHRQEHGQEPAPAALARQPAPMLVRAARGVATTSAAATADADGVTPVLYPALAHACCLMLDLPHTRVDATARLFPQWWGSQADDSSAQVSVDTSQQKA